MENLTAQKIDLISQQIDDYCNEKNIARKEVIRTKLIAEEILLHYLDLYGDDCSVDFSIEKFFSKGKLHFTIKCDKSNPFKTNDDTGIMQSLTAADDFNPKWRYVSNANIITVPFKIKKSINNLGKIIIALIIGTVLGLIGRLPAVSGIATTLISDYISPLTDAYTGILCVMAIMLVFFTFPLGVVQLGNTMSFHKMSAKILATYAGISVFSVLVSMLCCLPQTNIVMASGNIPDVLKSSFDVLLGFIPTNIVTPFVNFNCMQVLIIGLMFGFSFLAMGEKSNSIVSAFDKINLVAVLTNNYLTKIIHIYVGLMMFKLVATSNYSQMKTIFNFAPIIIVIAVILPLILMLAVCVKYKVKFSVLFKKLFPAFIINFSSATIGASFIDFFNELNLDCGVETSYTTVSCNVGVVLFKPMYSVFLTVAALISAGSLGIEISPIWIITLLIMSIMLSMAIPNIPGGAASVIVLLFGQLGFSNDICETVVSLNVILQFIIVPVNVLCMQCVTILLAEKQNALDAEILRKAK